MRLIKNLRAYYTGMIKCNNLDRMTLPPYIYDYSKNEMSWFIKGLLTSADKANGKLYYKHPSVVYLVNVEKILKDNGIKTNLICNDTTRCIEITK